MYRKLRRGGRYVSRFLTVIWWDMIAALLVLLCVPRDRSACGEPIQRVAQCLLVMGDSLLPPGGVGVDCPGCRMAVVDHGLDGAGLGC